MILAGAQIVNSASDHFFAGTRLALNEDRRIRRRNDSNAFEHSFQPLTVSNNLPEIVLQPDFVFEVECRLRQSVPGFRHLFIFQSILYADSDLGSYLCQEPYVILAESILLPSTESQKTNAMIPTD